jgi:hypothetical protein
VDLRESRSSIGPRQSFRGREPHRRAFCWALLLASSQHLNRFDTSCGNLLTARVAGWL